MVVNAGLPVTLIQDLKRKKFGIAAMTLYTPTPPEYGVLRNERKRRLRLREGVLDPADEAAYQRIVETHREGRVWGLILLDN